MAILFKGEKSSKVVNAWGYDRVMLVLPIVATTEFEMGVGVALYEVDDPQHAIATRFWGLVSPQDVITCWRGMLLLQEINLIEERHLSGAYYAAMRNPHDSEKHHGDEFSLKIGKDRYQSIMSMPIPEEVISKIVTIIDEGGTIALWPITEEVEAGTLEWREDFTRIGAKHPREVAEREAAHKRLLERYESYLSAYARSGKYSRQSLIMGYVEGNLISAVERGIDKSHGNDVALGIAIARAHAGAAAFAGFLGFGSEESFNREVLEGRQKAAQWLITQFKTGWWFSKKPLRSVSEYLKLITEIDRQWEQMPIVAPLA